MELIRVYLDTSVINSFIFGIDKEPKRYIETAKLFKYLKEEKYIAVISFYTLLEVYWFCLDNFPENESQEKARKALLEILSYIIKLIPLLKREDRIKLSHKIFMTDSSDIPHAMMAYTYHCDYIISYDSSFESVSSWIKFLFPGEFLALLDKNK